MLLVVTYKIYMKLTVISPLNVPDAKTIQIFSCFFSLEKSLLKTRAYTPK